MPTTLLTVTGNPSTYTAGNWPDTAMNSAVWRFTFTFSAASTGASYSGFCALFCGPVVGGTTGGLFIVDNARLELYDVDDNLVFTRTITWGAGTTITVTISNVADTVTIAGATTGNGTFGFTDSAPYFNVGTTLSAGAVTGETGFACPGTFGNIDDASTGTTLTASGGSFALTGTAAPLRRALRMSAASGTFALTGADAALSVVSGLAAQGGTFNLTGSDATLRHRRAIRMTADAGAFTLAGQDATLRVSGAISLGDHDFDFQPFPFSDRDALITLTTQAGGSIVVLASGGKSSDVTQAWTDSKGNTIRKLAIVQDYPDFAGYGTQVGVTHNPMTGGASHAFTFQVGNEDENTSFAVEVIGGRRVKHLHLNDANAGAGTTLAIGPITTDGPAALIALWWGSSPVNPPFTGSSGPGGGGIGTPFTAVPDSGFTVLDENMNNFEFGEVQAACAAKVVDVAGSYSVTWTHSPAQGAQLWLVAVEPAAVLTASPGTFTFTGSDATLRVSRRVKLTADGGSLTLTGTAAALLVGHKLVAASGSFAITGTAAGLRAARRIAAAGGVLALTGGAATLLVARRMAAVGGAFALTGSAATLRRALRMVASGGAVALTGADASLSTTTARSMAASPGTFALTGGAATFRRTYVLAAAGGAFTVTGSAAGLVVAGAPVLVAESASFALAGGAAVLLVGRRMAAAGAAYALTGQDATLTRGQRRMVAAPGAFAVTGTPASLVFSGAADAQTVVEDAIYAWVVAGSGLAAGQVIWAPEATGGGPAPSGTYISMRWLDINRVSDDWTIPRDVGGQIIHHVRGTRHPTLELTCFAGARYGAGRAAQILDRVLTAIRLPTVAAALRAGDVGIGKRGKIRVASGQRSSMFDPRAIVEVGLHTTIDISEPGHSIERAEYEVMGVAQAVDRP